VTKTSPLIPLLALLTLSAAASDFTGLKQEMDSVADKVFLTLKEEGQDRIAIRDFTSPSFMQANFSNALKDELTCSLKEKKVNVDAQATYEISGEYRIAQDETDPAKKSDLHGLLIQFELKDQKNNKSLGKFAHQVFDNSLMSSVAGINGSVKPNDSLEKRNTDLYNKSEHPEYSVSNSEVIVGQFGVEVGIFDGHNFTPRAIFEKNHSPYVELNHNDQYAIKLINNSDYDVAVLLTVDGINTFHFSEIRNDKGEPRYSHWIVGAHSNSLIKGWHKDLKQMYSFFITDVPNSAAGQLKSVGSIGVINAQFHAVIVGGAHNATDEGKTRGADLATGKGPPIDAASKEVAVKFGAMRTSITVRYGK